MSNILDRLWAGFTARGLPIAGAMTFQLSRQDTDPAGCEA